MYRIAHVSEVDQLQDVPPEIKELAEEIVAFFDLVYGADRDVMNDDGGYVVILCPGDDLSLLDDINIRRLMPEMTEIVETPSGGPYTHSLVLFNNEYAIDIIMERAKTPENLLLELIEKKK